MKSLRITTVALGIALATSAAVAAAGYPGQQLAGNAHITLAQARTIAVRTAPGSIVSQELEKEAGGSGLRYSFDIKTAQGVREIGVDAATGTVLENSADAPAAAAPNATEKHESDGD